MRQNWVKLPPAAAAVNGLPFASALGFFITLSSVTSGAARCQPASPIKRERRSVLIDFIIMGLFD
jgi:hypothetical protein